MLNYKKSRIDRRNMYGTENVKQITEMERKKAFESTAYFNFDGNAGLKSIFDFDFDVERIVDELANIVYV